jgi:anthranilate 1,2-dioxygenase small subunit
MMQQRIECLLADYAHCIDDERYEAWPEFFTEACLYQIISRDSYRHGRPLGFLFCDSRGMLRDRVSSMGRANIFEPHTYRHVISATSVDLLPDGAYAAKTSYIVVRIMHDGTQEIFSTGCYLDEIVEQDGRLLFRQRIVVCDSSRIDSLLVIPL